MNMNNQELTLEKPNDKLEIGYNSFRFSTPTPSQETIHDVLENKSISIAISVCMLIVTTAFIAVSAVAFGANLKDDDSEMN